MTLTSYTNWNGHNVKLTWKPTCTLPEEHLITSVHGYCFHEGKVLLVKIKDRGINTPGGHLERGESPEEAFIREAEEEGYVRGSISIIGYVEVSHEDNPLFDPNGKYPLIGYQVYYRMDIEECLPFLADYESLARIWVEPELVSQVIDDNLLQALILKEAVQSAKGISYKLFPN